MLSNFADHLSANYLWMMFCRLSSVGCLLFLFFCCLSVVYLVELYVFWVIWGNEAFALCPSENSSFFWLSFFMDFWLILVPFWLHFGSTLHNFCIVFSSIDFERFFIRFWSTFWMLKTLKCVFFPKEKPYFSQNHHVAKNSILGSMLKQCLYHFSFILV